MISSLKYLLLALFISNITHAGWVVKNSLTDLDGNNRSTIRKVLDSSPTDFVGSLLKENLTSLNPVEIKKAHFDHSVYEWKNDETCQVEDPSKVPSVTASSFWAIYTYFYSYGTSGEYTQSVLPMFRNPCQAHASHIVRYRFKKIGP